MMAAREEQDLKRLMRAVKACLSDAERIQVVRDAFTLGVSVSERIGDDRKGSLSNDATQLMLQEMRR